MYDLAASIATGILAEPAFQANTNNINGNLKVIGAALAIGIGGIGPGIGIGIAARGALEAIGRNPETEGAVRNTLILGAGLAEAVAIYALLIALIIIFVG